jgi:peptidoglycan hydrolase-like protein with peptidoglycan-binding domain
MAIDALTLIQLAIKYGPIIKEVIDVASSNEDLIARVKRVAAPLIPFLEDIGAKLFPKASPSLHIVGGILSAFDPNLTKWLQGSINTLVTPSPNLAVDGLYGPQTRAAVEKIQKQLNLLVDGIAGSITQAAIQSALAKLEQQKANSSGQQQ